MFWFTAVKAETSAALPKLRSGALSMKQSLSTVRVTLTLLLAVPSSYTQTGPMPAAHRCQAQFRPMVSV